MDDPLSTIGYGGRVFLGPAPVHKNFAELSSRSYALETETCAGRPPGCVGFLGLLFYWFLLNREANGGGKALLFIHPELGKGALAPQKKEKKKKRERVEGCGESTASSCERRPRRAQGDARPSGSRALAGVKRDPTQPLWTFCLAFPEAFNNGSVGFITVFRRFAVVWGRKRTDRWEKMLHTETNDQFA